MYLTSEESVTWKFLTSTIPPGKKLIFNVMLFKFLSDEL